jgi:FMN phosphatase YigB (HAD superfamily)
MCTSAKMQKDRSIRKNKNNKSHSAHIEKYVVLFDLMNVVIKENYGEFAKRIGYARLAGYTFTHFKNPGFCCLDMLDAMSKHETQKPHIHITLKNRALPRCLIELQEGKKNATQVKDEIVQCIECLHMQNHFSSAKEKALMTDIMTLALDPQSTTWMMEPVKTTAQLVPKLKAAGHTVYLFANAPDELYTAVQKKYPHIIAQFDGIVISSQIKTAKPDPVIFNHLLTTHKLSPENCILIDDAQESVTAAKKLGMQAFVYDKKVEKNLKKCGVKI